MSMIGNVRRARDEDITRLLAHPEEIRAYLHGQRGSYEDQATLWLEKTWHGIHFVLTGSAEGGEPPLNFLVSGGTLVGAVNVGYGPARAFTSTQVRQLDEALEAITPDEFERRIDLDALHQAGIYPDVWDREDERDFNFAYLTGYFGKLRQYVQDLARGGWGMLVYIT